MRTCPGCGEAERRTKDARGKDLLNLDPTTGLCVRCLVTRGAARHQFHSRRATTQGQVFDARAAAARNNE